MAERKAWWEILRDQFASRGLLDPESERVQETVRAAPAAQRQARGLLSLDPQAESDTALEMGLGALPGVGQAMALRDLERARRAKDPGAAAMAASNFIPFGTLLNRFRRGPMSELDVYHGTPHRFPATEANPLGEFDASKIGTGEGAQAYGHGVYLAESPGVANAYKTALEAGKGDRDEDVIARLLAATKGDRAAAAEEFRRRAEFANYPEGKQRMLSLAEKVESGVDPRGSLYKADLPDEMIDRMLDWDKPLSEQSAAVQKLLIKHWNPDEKLVTKSGESLWQELSRPGLQSTPTSGGGQNAAEWLKSIGIPGIKYLDAGSRGQGGSGTRNFVVFPGEEKKVRILERNGQPAPERIAQALEAAPQGGKVVGIRSRQTAKMADRINEALGGGPQPLSDNVQREMKLATSVLQSKNPQAVEDWIQAYYDADLPMEQFEAATTNLRKTLPPETVDALIQNAGAFGTADQFKAFLSATPAERAKQLAKVSK